MEQDDGVGVAVYDLPPERHVGIVVGSRGSLHQSILGEWADVFKRYRTPNLFDTSAVFLGNIVLAEKDVLEHRLVVIDKLLQNVTIFGNLTLIG